MKVLVFGASGIIGQHLRLCCPDGIQPIWYRQTPDPITRGVDLCDGAALAACLAEHDPDVIVNLAGESRPDAVEREAAVLNRDEDDGSAVINVAVPLQLAEWCEKNGKRLVHVSSQAVFSGVGPCGPYSMRCPVNRYGEQKRWAEMVLTMSKAATVIRPTFVLGVRPLPHVGRANPAEQMLDGQCRQVNDRWFSPLFARDAARLFWSIVTHDDGQRIIHLGIPRRISRYDVAVGLGIDAVPVSHDDFSGIAPRPLDTTYDAATARHGTSWESGLTEIRRDWQSRQDMDVADRARESALFLGMREDDAYGRLGKGFGFQHAEVTADFRQSDPKTDDALLDWYRRTEAYIWELSAYHTDPGWNYMGMCGGIAERLRASGAKRVLCLGDGIGDCTLSLCRAGFEAVYHDLAGSRTAEFAAFRFWRHTGQPLPVHLTQDWQPVNGNRQPYDAVVSLDFLEHVTDVPAWAGAVKQILAPGGLFCAQNAFAIGSGPDGSLPMHLARNDRFERDWDPLLAGLGFQQLSSQWYQRAA